jgi:tetratricopeptide (TPR) repeat protein
LGFVTEALEQIRLGQYARAAEILKENLQDSTLKPSARIDLMEWIADCYSKEEEYAEATNWFETAANAVLEFSEIPNIEKRRRAMKDIEKALECCKSQNDIAGIKRLTKMKFSLKPDL